MIVVDRHAIAAVERNVMERNVIAVWYVVLLSSFNN